MKNHPFCFTAMLVLIALTLTAEQIRADWPEFRGPTGDGHAESAKPPLRWSATEGIRWKVPVPGKAWSTPVVAGDRVFVSTAIGEDGSPLSLCALAFDLASGKELWRTEIFHPESVFAHQKNSQASPTPVYAEGRLYVHFGHYGTAALDASDGKVLWTQTTLSYAPTHGNGGSPVLYGGKLIYACDGESDPFVVALDAKDGSIAWKSARNVVVSKTFSFSTPLLVSIQGKTQAIIPGSGAVISYDPDTGREIWRFRYGEGFSVVPRPVFQDGIVYVCSGFARAVLYAIRTDGQGDVTDTHLAWKEEKRVPRESSPILVSKLIFFNDDKGILSCLDAETGAVHYQERLDGRGGYSSSPVYANSHLYFHNGDGVTTVIRPDKTFQKIAENELGEYGLSSFAVIADGFIFRTENHLLRIGK